jgi:Notch-like protein
MNIRILLGALLALSLVVAACGDEAPSDNESTNNEVSADPCADEPCENGGQCVSDGDEFVCECPADYEGDRCQTVIDDCDPNPCLNGASCVDGVDAFTCECAAGFEGDLCDTNIDDCESNPCLNGGTCADGTDSFTCTCAAGWEGDTCADNIDDCAASPCLNGGTCVDELASYTCECAVFSSGDDCACVMEPVSELPAGTTGGLQGYFLGFEFQPTEDITIDELGVVDWYGTVEATGPMDPEVTVDGLSEPAPVALYDSTGQIASTTVSPTDPAKNGFRWGSIPEVTLTAGETYAVVALVMPPNAFADNGSAVQYDARINSLRALSTSSNDATTLPAAYGANDNSWSNNYYGASIGIRSCD